MQGHSYDGGYAPAQPDALLPSVRRHQQRSVAVVAAGAGSVARAGEVVAAQ